jgi:hypothetical protein
MFICIYIYLHTHEYTGGHQVIPGEHGITLVMERPLNAPPSSQQMNRHIGFEGPFPSGMYGFFQGKEFTHIYNYTNICVYITRISKI